MTNLPLEDDTLVQNLEIIEKIRQYKSSQK